MDPNLARKNRRTALMVCAILAAMGLLTYKSADLYRLYCQIMGIGGQATRAEGPSGKIYDREITVRLNSDTDPGLTWEFKPDTPSVTVKVGQEALVSFTARNVSGKPVAGTAIYTVAPEEAGLYLSKTQCFCFDYQLIAPGKTAHFPVVFYIDPKIMEDRALRNLKTMTLSYTFFKADSPALEQALEGFYNDPKSANKAVPIN